MTLDEEKPSMSYCDFAEATANLVEEFTPYVIVMNAVAVQLQCYAHIVTIVNAAICWTHKAVAVISFM